MRKDNNLLTTLAKLVNNVFKYLRSDKRAWPILHLLAGKENREEKRTFAVFSCESFAYFRKISKFASEETRCENGSQICIYRHIQWIDESKKWIKRHVTNFFLHVRWALFIQMIPAYLFNTLVLRRVPSKSMLLWCYSIAICWFVIYLSYLLAFLLYPFLAITFSLFFRTTQFSLLINFACHGNFSIFFLVVIHDSKLLLVK